MSEAAAAAPPPLFSYFARAPSGSGSVVTKPDPPSIHHHASLGHDLGAMALLRYRHPALSLHRSIRELGDGLANAFQLQPTKGQWPQASLIMGHGSPGFIEIGDGQFGYSDDGSLRLDNIDRWRAQLERIAAPHVWIQARAPGFPPDAFHRRLMLISCSTAAGPDGRALLQAMADAANARVSACTGLVYISRDGEFYEKGANMPWCVPTGSPAERCPESYWRGPHDFLPSAMKLFSSEKLSRAALAGQAPVERLKLTDLRSHRQWDLPPELAGRVAALLTESSAYQDDGGLVGAATIRIEIAPADSPPLAGSLLSDRLFVTETGLAYVVPPGLRALLAELGDSPA